MPKFLIKIDRKDPSSCNCHPEYVSYENEFCTLEDAAADYVRVLELYKLKFRTDMLDREVSVSLPDRLFTKFESVCNAAYKNLEKLNDLERKRSEVKSKIDKLRDEAKSIADDLKRFGGDFSDEAVSSRRSRIAETSAEIFTANRDLEAIEKAIKTWNNTR